MKTNGIIYNLLTSALRVALVLSLLLSGWLIYSKLPHQASSKIANSANTTLQIILRPAPNGAALDIPFELYPFDIVAARHEFFAERRAGTRFDDFLNERMKGRTPVDGKFDKQGQAVVVVTQGTWWLHTQFAGEENLEWRLKIDTSGVKQVVELTPENIYMRSRSF
ncbi:MAG TPA: hypothetical protein VLL54_17795 [Pyrinomonadaceae bacterium]|nr:hypothetical protein [Pyrinomonadaceae bacterium]